MRRVFFGCLIFVFLFSINLYCQNYKIGVFDLQKVMVLSDAGKDIKTFLQQKKAYYQQQIKKRESELKKMKEDIEKKSMMLSETARQEKKQEYQSKVRELKLYIADSENELKSLYATKTQKLIHDILKVARDYAKKNNFSLLIERQEGGVVYFSKSIDVTNDILREFNLYYKSHKSE